MCIIMLYALACIIIQYPQYHEYFTSGEYKSVMSSFTASESAPSSSSEFDRFLISASPTHTADLKTLEPFTYIANLPGKDVRGKLVECFNEWLRVEPERLVDVREIVGSL